MKKVKKTKKKEEEKFEQLPLGLKEDSYLQILFSKFKRNFTIKIKDIRYSGVFSDLWLWSLCFINLFFIVLISNLVLKYFNTLPENIGINAGTSDSYNLIINKNLLFIPILAHAIFLIVSFIFRIIYQKKVNHLFILMSLYILVIGIFEFMSIKGLIAYFA